MFYNGFFGCGNKYPYTDAHNANLDWMIKKIQQFEDALNKVLDTGFEKSKAYTDSAVAAEKQERVAEVLHLRVEFNELRSTVDDALIELDNQYQAFEALVDAKLVFLQRQLDDLSLRLVEELRKQSDYTDGAISNAIDKLLATLPGAVVDKIRVINFFTGDMVNLQDMFDYLATLHIDNGLTYDEIAARRKTYNQMGQYGVTYTQMVINGKNILT